MTTKRNVQVTVTYKTNFLNIMDAMTKRTFFIKKPDRFDFTHQRDAQFVKRGVNPIFQPEEGSMSWSFVPIVNIIELIYKNVYVEFESDKELNELLIIMGVYLKEVDNFDIDSLQKNSNEAIFMKRFLFAYNQLDKLNKNRKDIDDLRHPDRNTIKNIFDRINKF